jgi:hypothetical protein
MGAIQAYAPAAKNADPTASPMDSCKTAGILQRLQALTGFDLIAAPRLGVTKGR